jgi:hypothetical protein
MSAILFPSGKESLHDGREELSLVRHSVCQLCPKEMRTIAYLRNLTKKLPDPSRGPLGFRNRPMTMVEKRTSWMATLVANCMSV